MTLMKFVAVGVTAGAGLMLLGASLQKGEVRTYKIILSNGDLVTLPGTSIRSSGFCTEILLGGRVDSVICLPRYITEVPTPPAEEEEVVPEPDPEPSHTPGPTSRGM